MVPKSGASARKWLERGLYGLGILLLLTWAAIHLNARLYQARQMRALDTIDTPSEVQHAPGDYVPPRTLLGRIDIPRLGLSAIVSEGTDAATLLRAVGHLTGTAFPGHRGNAVLAGHRDTFFRPLAQIAENDTIRVTTPYGRFGFRVVSLRIVSPTDAEEVLQPTPTPTLTLVTCYPFRYIGRAPMRFIVRAVALRDQPIGRGAHGAAGTSGSDQAAASS